MPPNAWLWSLIEGCQNQDDINLLFEVLQKLRRFVSTFKKCSLVNIEWLKICCFWIAETIPYQLMTLVKTNDLPLQPGTADLVFRICNDTDKWDLLGKY